MSKQPLNEDKASGGCHGFLQEIFELARKNPDAITPRRNWYFEENIDEETGKRFHYSKHVKLRYQTCCMHDFVVTDGRYKRNNAYEKKISDLIYTYIMKALEDSPEVVYYISLNSYEDEDFKTIRCVPISAIQSNKDLHIGDRECLRIYRDDPMLEILNDETGYLVLENPTYYGY